MEIGSVTTANVSAYQRNRVQVSNLFSYETRTLNANLNGIIPKGAQIVDALWQTWNGSNVIMSNPQASSDQRSASIKIMAQIGGFAIIKGSFTTDSGDVYVQQFRVNIQWAPVYYPGSWVIGPQQVQWTAP